MHSFASKTFFASTRQAIHHADYSSGDLFGYPSGHLLSMLIYPPMYSAALIDCHRAPPCQRPFAGTCTLHQFVGFVRPPSSQLEDSSTFNAPGRVRTSTTTRSSSLPACCLGLIGSSSVSFKSACGRGQRGLPGASYHASGRLWARCHGSGAHAGGRCRRINLKLRGPLKEAGRHWQFQVDGPGAAARRQPRRGPGHWAAGRPAAAI
jgi:hypothetical protein